MVRFLFLSLCFATPSFAETLVASRNIRAQSILSATDLAVIDRSIPGMVSAFEDAIGKETRIALYAGRPIRFEDLGPPAIIDRNQIVTLIYQTAGLRIATDARALNRAGIGDLLRVMNLSSKSTVSGIVAPDGTVRVSGAPTSF